KLTRHLYFDHAGLVVDRRGAKVVVGAGELRLHLVDAGAAHFAGGFVELDAERIVVLAVGLVAGVHGNGVHAVGDDRGRGDGPGPCGNRRWAAMKAAAGGSSPVRKSGSRT